MSCRTLLAPSVGNPSPPDTPARRSDRELATLLNQARTSIRGIVDAVRHEQPDLMPTGLDLPGILVLIPPGGALVAPLLTSPGSAVFVLPPGAETVEAQHVITLEGFGDADLRELLLEPEDDPHSAGWMGAYFGFCIGKTGAFFEAWHTTLTRNSFVNKKRAGQSNCWWDQPGVVDRLQLLEGG